ncbi:antibiotic biosynthesis monooxygenase [Streptomyces gilvosporeus]|uniref:ABM domain-containing protein n=1 Tax=Streptomyces gilvosporeus TaxID=553510 RepID=A0A1V0TJ25_9ACTN|nr:antibiotic biosynthesis monooxygenase [Streptomyces gilvosporeus]ARF52929.1 hypothetical protein B1H19_00800 [Streptomyces gilvosporeus]
MTHFSDLIHADTGTALISEWITGTPERSHAVADAVIDEWAAGEKPSARLAQHMFLSTDGASLLFYAQWTSDEDHLAWARAHRSEMVSRIDTLVPGIERPGLNRTRLHSSLVHDAGPHPGVFVVTTTVADEVEATVRPAPGLLAAHIHLTTDGQPTTDGGRAVIVTEWTDAASHDAAAATHATGALGFKRYTLHHSFPNGVAQRASSGT